MKKLCFLFLMLFMLTGCNSINKVPTNQNFLEEYNAQSNTIKYDSYEVANENLLKKENKFISEVNFFKKDEYANYETKVNFEYNFNYNTGWTLTNCSEIDKSINCFKARTLEEIENDISENCTDYIEGCTKIKVKKVEEISDGNIQKLSIECERKKGAIVSTYNNATVEFIYNDGKWEFKNTLEQADNYYIDIDLKDTVWISPDRPNYETMRANMGLYDYYDEHDIEYYEKNELRDIVITARIIPTAE